MAVRPEDIGPLLLLISYAVGPLVATGLILLIVWCCDCEPEAEQGYDAAAAAGRSSRTTPGSQRWRTAPAAVHAREPQQLAYFSYPAAADAEGGRGMAGASVVVCAICLEALVGGAECSEVPACRHVFHRGCLAPWMKSNSTCPLCRRPVVPGSSEPLSAAEAMV